MLEVRDSKERVRNVQKDRKFMIIPIEVSGLGDLEGYSLKELYILTSKMVDSKITFFEQFVSHINIDELLDAINDPCATFVLLSEIKEEDN